MVQSWVHEHAVSVWRTQQYIANLRDYVQYLRSLEQEAFPDGPDRAASPMVNPLASVHSGMSLEQFFVDALQGEALRITARLNSEGDQNAVVNYL